MSRWTWRKFLKKVPDTIEYQGETYYWTPHGSYETEDGKKLSDEVCHAEIEKFHGRRPRGGVAYG